jgi:hypothetical protein
MTIYNHLLPKILWINLFMIVCGSSTFLTQNVSRVQSRDGYKLSWFKWGTYFRLGKLCDDSVSRIYVSMYIFKIILLYTKLIYDRGLIPGKGRDFFSLPLYPYRIW